MQRACAVRTAAAVALTAALAGCSGAVGTDAGSSPATATTGAPGDSAVALTGSVSQFREDEVARRIRVRLTSTGPATVTALSLEWPGLPGLPSVAPDYPLQPGVAVDLPLPLGPAACGTPARADAPVPATGPGDVTAVVTLRGPDGTTATRRIGLDGGGGTLDRVFAGACRQQALADLVAVGFGPTWRRGTAHGLPAQLGELQLRRAASTDALTVTELDGSVVMDLTAQPPDALPVTMAASTATLAVPIAITTSGRCSGHELGETKQPYVYEVYLDVGRQAGLTGVQPVIVSPPPEVRNTLWQTTLDGCAALGGHPA